MTKIDAGEVISYVCGYDMKDNEIIWSLSVHIIKTCMQRLWKFSLKNPTDRIRIFSPAWILENNRITITVLNSLIALIWSGFRKWNWELKNRSTSRYHFNVVVWILVTLSKSQAMVYSLKKYLYFLCNLEAVSATFPDYLNDLLLSELGEVAQVSWMFSCIS